MRKLSLTTITLALVAAAGFAHATPEALPDGAKLHCTANADGTGTLKVTGVEVKRVELYIHAPVSKMNLLDKAETYTIPASTTFNIVFKGKSGDDRYVALGDESLAVAKVFKAGGTGGGTFDGVIIVPDKAHGGIGGPGASMGCAHMLRSKPVEASKKTGA